MIWIGKLVYPSHVSACAASQAAAKNLSSRGRKLETDLFQQQEVVYGQDFALMSLQRKLAKLEGFVVVITHRAL